MESLRSFDPPGKTGAFDAAHLRHLADASIFLATDLHATEKLLLVALVQMDGIAGCSPSNADIARMCGFKTTSPDGGHNAARALLRGLKAKAYIVVEAADQTDDNPTGRMIHLLPKAMGWEGGR